jgi:hypothetical protein
MNLVLGITSIQKPNHNTKDDVTKKIRLAFYNKDSRGEPYRYVETTINLDESNLDIATKFKKLANDIEELK